jgi:CheY-like chemotaxis protein
MKRHDQLRAMPVVVWTTSDADHDIQQCYALGARCYVTKPVDLTAFQSVMRSIERFWFSVVQLP